MGEYWAFVAFVSFWEGLSIVVFACIVGVIEVAFGFWFGVSRVLVKDGCYSYFRYRRFELILVLNV